MLMPNVPSLKTARLGEADAKRDFNRIHFGEAASRYDFATKALSLGGDAGWKRQLIAALPNNPQVVLDLACGTGDVCILLGERFSDTRIEGLDLTREMLDIAEQRNTYGERIRFVQGDLCALPQAEESMDVVTGSYALRNAPDSEIGAAGNPPCVKTGWNRSLSRLLETNIRRCAENAVSSPAVLGWIVGAAPTRKSCGARLYRRQSEGLPDPPST